MKKTIFIFSILCFLIFINKTSNAQPLKLPEWSWFSKITNTNCFAVDASKDLFFAKDSLKKIDNTNHPVALKRIEVNKNDIYVIPKIEEGAMIIDDLGNIYLSGFASSEYTIDNNGNPTDKIMRSLFLKKYDAKVGKWGFSKYYENASGILTSLAVDASKNTYMAGSFNSDVLDFGNNKFMDNPDKTGNTSDLFVAKSDSKGIIKYSIHGIGDNNDVANSIAVDVQKSIYLAGSFNSKKLMFYNGSVTLKNKDTTGNSYDLFIEKFDSSGNAKWNIQGCGDKDDEALSIAVDASGFVYVVGYFKSKTFIFDKDTLINKDKNPKSNTSDLFLAKIDTAGKTLWVKSVGGINDDEAKSIAIDASGYIYVSGVYKSDILSFGTNVLSNNNTKYSALFIAKYDTSGNPLWAKSLGGNSANFGDVHPSSIKIDNSDNVYLMGYFNGGCLTFNSSSNYLCNDNYDPCDNCNTYFVAKLSTK